MTSTTDTERSATRHLHWALGALMLTLLLAALDQTIVSTALPTITSDLAGLNELSWVVTAYMLAATASTPIWGKISDLYGRKPMLQLAVVIFVVGVGARAGSPRTWRQLIATPRPAGLGGGGLMVLVMAVIADLIPPRERGRYAGLFGAVFGIASVIGPAARRVLHRAPLVAVDLLHQPSAGDRGVPGARIGAAPSASPDRAPHRLDRCLTAGRAVSPACSGHGVGR